MPVLVKQKIFADRAPLRFSSLKEIATPSRMPTKARILHVDDHQDTRLMMAALLMDAGYGVMTAGSVTEGLQLAREITFDLFLLDVRLPDGTGIELCQKLRELHPNVPVMYYSAYGERDAEEALRICGDAFLHKPISIAEIEQTISRLLSEKARR